MTLNTKLAIQCAKSIACLYDGMVAPSVVNSGTGAEALIEEHHDGRWAVIFPGTSGRADWLTNFKFRRTPFLSSSSPSSSPLSATAHRGFIAAYESVERQISDRIPEGSRVILAGHSLGGALATLCADDMHGRFNVESVFTFGSPRVGNGAFVRRYNDAFADRTARIVNARDPVPYAPPWLFGNRHVATEIYLNDSGKAERERSLLSIASDRAADVIEKIQDHHSKRLVSISAHYISSYILKLEALA